VAVGLLAVFTTLPATASPLREGAVVKASGDSGTAREGGESNDQLKRIDINQASVEELCTLPGIGKKRAEAIIEYRRRRPFTRLTQLLNIRGIGKRTLEKLRPRLMIGPATPDPLVSASRASD